MDPMQVKTVLMRVGNFVLAETTHGEFPVFVMHKCRLFEDHFRCSIYDWDKRDRLACLACGATAPQRLKKALKLILL